MTEEEFKKAYHLGFRRAIQRASWTKSSTYVDQVADEAWERYLETSGVCDLTFAHTRHWCNNFNCREN